MKKKNWSKYQIYLEIAKKMTDLQAKIESELGEKIAIDLSFPETFTKIFNAIEVLKDGTNFSSHFNKIKFETLLEAGDSQIAHLAQSYKTSDKRFTTDILSTFGPRDDDWTLRVSKLTSSEFIHV